MAHKVIDGFDKQLRKTFTKSELKIDNFIFTLHHNVSFVIILVGLLFITGNNYLNTEAITCFGGNSYVNNYCFLHGTGHLRPPELADQLSPGKHRCTAVQDPKEEGDERHTHYYIWLPYVLCIIAVLTKLPRVLWRNVFEGNTMEDHKKDLEANKNNAKFYRVVMKGKTSYKAVLYNFSYFFCEILNLLMVVISRAILDSLLNGKFSSYGTDVNQFFTILNDDEHVEKLPNPMCNLFPTEVSCSVSYGAPTGGANKINTLCLLQNNVFNQYFFLILWWWYIILITISCIGILYRLIQLSIGQLGMMRLVVLLTGKGVKEYNQHCVRTLKLRPWEIFLFTRLAINITGDQINGLIEAIMDEDEKPEDEKAADGAGIELMAGEKSNMA